MLISVLFFVQLNRQPLNTTALCILSIVSSLPGIGQWRGTCSSSSTLNIWYYSDLKISPWYVLNILTYQSSRYHYKGCVCMSVRLIKYISHSFSLLLFYRLEVLSIVFNTCIELLNIPCVASLQNCLSCKTYIRPMASQLS